MGTRSLPPRGSDPESRHPWVPDFWSRMWLKVSRMWEGVGAWVEEALEEEPWHKVRLQRGRWEIWGYSVGWSGCKMI